MSRKNLLCISRGPNGVPTVAEKNRNWDWVEFHWQPDATLERFGEGPELVIPDTDRSHKHYSVIRHHAARLNLGRYERIGVVDDDVTPGTSWSELFDAFEAFEAQGCCIGQGAHMTGSFGAHEHLKVRPLPIVAREVTFVDDVCAFFTRETFKRVLSVASEAHFDFAIDRVWSSWKLPMFVLDIAPVHNTQEQGKHYDRPWAMHHVAECLKEHGIRNDHSIPRQATAAWIVATPRPGERVIHFGDRTIVRRV